MDWDRSQWSPADHPYAIAVSEAQWWERAAQLALLRLDDPDDHRISFSSRQIDARQLIIALRQLLVAEQLEQAALAELGIDQAVCDRLALARRRFETALPGLKDMRDALVHFDDWSRGTGRGAQGQRVQAGAPLREVASEFWGFGYGPATRTITFGPHIVEIDVVRDAAIHLLDAIYAAASSVDDRNAAASLALVRGALDASAIEHNMPGAATRVQLGRDRRVWVSLNSGDGTGKHELLALAQRVVDAIAKANLALADPGWPGAHDPVSNLAMGNALVCEQAPRP